MSTIDKINLLIKERGITGAELTRAIGIKSTGTYSQWNKGTTEISNKNLKKIADFFGVPVSYFLDDASRGVLQDADAIPPGFSPMPKMVKRPLVGRIACGEPITAEQNIEKYVDVPEDVRCDFCLECDGDSMIDVGIHSGDVVYIRIQPEVENGEIAAVRIGEEATLKKVYYDGESLILMPCNSVYQPKTYSGSALADIKIEGKAVGFTHWF